MAGSSPDKTDDALPAFTPSPLTRRATISPHLTPDARTMPNQIACKCPLCGTITFYKPDRFRGGETRCGISGCSGLMTRAPHLERRVAHNLDGKESSELPLGEERNAPAAAAGGRKVRCERCRKKTHDIRRAYADYMVCPACATWHEGLRRRHNTPS